MNEAFLAKPPPGSMEEAEGIARRLETPPSAARVRQMHSNRVFGDLPTAESYYYFDALALLSAGHRSGRARGRSFPTRTDVLGHIPAVHSIRERHPLERSGPRDCCCSGKGLAVRYEGMRGPLDLNANGSVDEDDRQSFRILRSVSGRIAFRSFVACVPYE